MIKRMSGKGWVGMLGIAGAALRRQWPHFQALCIFALATLSLAVAFAIEGRGIAALLAFATALGIVVLYSAQVVPRLNGEGAATGVVRFPLLGWYAYALLVVLLNAIALAR